MLLQLDPSVPLVWRTPTSLQFGVDQPRIVLDQVTLVEEVMLSALRTGTGPQRLQSLVAGAGGTADDVGALLAELEAVLLSGDDSQRELPRQSVLIDGEGAAAELLAEALGSDSFDVTMSSGAALDLIETPPDLVIIIASYAVQPRRYGRWLRTDVPHLPIVFGDGGVRIGPLVHADRGPCLFCIDLEHTDQDAAWPAVASQITERSAPSETPHTARLAAGIVGGLLSERLRETAETGSSAAAQRWSTASVHIATDGWVSRAEHHRHPQCGCQLG